ncbi:hypothetical protein NEF87_002907 [Candidatus Lokiarchaeum ossiferum]|uniref:Transcription regulator PadR N-terminal domain-containing protein n=1 Tax=Candidatus Lokiarchaeum ossiferum TaxID=2951803 RepID=A0ABY6HSX8_9ARCH|nr:hypothetical protein NEF87_002907 [Candidatus Lokiarchaeum sp. B-35]
MFSKKIRLDNKGKTVSVATALVLMAIDEIIEDPINDSNVVYGYQIMTHLRESYSWNVKSGTVYPILKKLDREFLIKKGVAQDRTDNNSKRQMIFYKLTPKGKKLTRVIKNLNDDALDAALSSNESNTTGHSKIDLKGTKFPDKKFAENYLGPFLIDFDSQVANQIPNKRTNDELDQLKGEIEKSIEQLEICKMLLQGQISRIDTLKRIKKK